MKLYEKDIQITKSKINMINSIITLRRLVMVNQKYNIDSTDLIMKINMISDDIDNIDKSFMIEKNTISKILEQQAKEENDIINEIRKLF